jgi:hypothetical protein
MSEPLYFEDIQDAVRSTQVEYGPPGFTQSAQSYTKYEIFSRWFRDDKVIITGGRSIERQIMLDEEEDDGVHTGPYSEDVVDYTDVMQDISVNWVFAKVGWTFNYDEVMSNRGGRELFDLIQTKRTAKLLKLAKSIENHGWSCPSSSSDRLNPWGVSYWIVKNPTRGFTGEYPSGFTDLAGIDLDDHPNFCNYSDTYTDVSRQDLIRSMRLMRLETEFVSPIEVGGDGTTIMETYRHYCNNGTYLDLLEKMEDQNENLGPDLGRSGLGTMMFNGNPIVSVPALGSDDQDPIYSINHDSFSPVVHDGNFLRESDVIRTAKNADTYVVFIYLKYNFLCTNRRVNGVIYRNV